ncbi:hypothetical protein V6N13_102560 [Hibiscus sabdariffa]|uniref:MADS-box domain-containing protein n=1 Tax=Hibiscus sabdariffa TaxID=183260 RepID=A0ABR2D4H0_9ROSI
MGYKRHPKKRNVDPSSRQTVYSKSRESILKKATEVSTLDDTDAGHVMLPTGELTNYTSKGRIEDMFLRYIEEQRDHSDGCVLLNFSVFVSQKISRMANLKVLSLSMFLPCLSPKYALHVRPFETEETLKRKLNELKWLKHKSEEKMRACDPVVARIYSNAEADYRKKVVTDALRKLEKLKAKMLEEEASSSNRTSDGASTSGRVGSP